jgi:hypothetical protein
MRSFSKRVVNRRRPVLMLETLEDRRVLSAGGLFSALQPLAAAPAPHSSLSSTLTSLVAIPTSALSEVGATGQNLGSTASASPAKAPALDVSLNLNVDVLFVHTQNLRLDVGLNPIGSDQPLATVANGGKVAKGSTGDTLLNIAPQIQLGVGGSNGVGLNVGTQVSAPTGPAIDVNAGAETGTAGGVTASLKGGDVQGTVDAPTGGATITLPTAPAGDVSTARAVSTPNLLEAGNTTNTVVSNSSVTAPAAILGASSTTPITFAPVPTPVTRVDGGGGSAVDAAALTLPTTGVAVADGAAGDAAVRSDLGGGTDPGTVLANPELESSGLATRFQPYSLDVGRSLAGIINPAAPQSSWLTTWLARLSHMAPWLIGLMAAGAGLEIRRRRLARLARNAKAGA